MAIERPATKPAETSADSTANDGPEEILTRAALMGLFADDEDLLRELVGLFLEDSPALLNDLRAGIAAQDAAKVERAAHSLKGSVGNFGVKSTADLALQLEIMGRSRTLDRAPEILTALEKEMSRVSARLAEIAAEKSS